MIAPDSRKKCLAHPIVWAFVACLLYWTYLFFTAKTIICFDSLDYEALGKMIVQQGWEEYFRRGPSREPVYPLIVASAMAIANAWKTAYLPVLMILQFLILLLSQWLLCGILCRLKIDRRLVALTILYFGFSPAIVNMALSVYSEIAAYPLVLAAVLLFVWAWKRSMTGTKGTAVATGLIMGLFFVLLTLTKAVFEIATLAFALPFFLVAAGLFFRRKQQAATGLLIFLLTALVVFESGVFLYKSLNKKYNGEFTLTSRGAWALYGNTVRRMEPLTMRKFLAAVAYAPGEGVCQKLFTVEECQFWSFQRSDLYGYGKLHALTGQGLTPREVNSTLVHLSIEQVKTNPFQFGLLAGVEGLKMVFWESTKIGFVDYAGWQMKLFDWPPFTDGLRLGMSLLSFTALLFLAGWVWKTAPSWAGAPETADDAALLLSVVFFFLLSFIGIYSCFFILTRYALPIAGLQLAAIAFFLNRVVSK